MTPNSSINTEVDYLRWKEWGVHNFARLSNYDKRYFDAELKGLPIASGSSPLQILEIGFGNGKFLQYCLDCGWDISGTEINPLLIEIAKEKGFHTVLSGNLLELTDRQFDLVVAFDVLEHIPQDEIIFF
jgi:2-polyprenyl-3-methyl-5-hydroxy-6-metoxy-1,4-benzoquinol methylase